MVLGFYEKYKTNSRCIKTKNIPYYFIDHAYLYHRKHSMFEQYGDTRNCIFRVCKNNYVINKITDTNDQRYLELKGKFLQMMS